MRTLALVALGLLGCGAKEAPMARDAEVAGGKVRFGLHLVPQPNLVYQLDCVAGVVICAKPIFEELWVRLGRTAEDDAALATWRELRTRYGGELRRIDRAEPIYPLLVSAGVPDLGERQRIAGLVTRTPEAWVAALGVVSSDDDARRLGGILERFEPRFARWWRDEGFAAGSKSFDGFAALLADPFLDDTVAKAAAFYGAELPDGPILDVHLIVQPASKRRFSVAIELERYAVVEAPAGTDPKALIDVITHEAFHYFFARMVPERRAALLQRFVDAPEPYAAAAFGVLDEAVAVTLGNGVVGRHYTPPEKFAARLGRDNGLVQYPAADRIAKALLPAIEPLLVEGDVSSERFAAAFLAAARPVFAGPVRAVDYLHAPIIVADPRFADAKQLLVDETHAGFPYLREYSAFGAEASAFLLERPLLSAAIFVASDADAARVLATLVPTEPAPAPTAAPHVLVVKRTTKSYLFVFVAADPAAMRALVADVVRSYP